MSSPFRSEQASETLTETRSPARYHDKLGSRFKDFINSPTRDHLNSPDHPSSNVSPLRSPYSPLKRLNQQKSVETEKYSTVEVKNEDHGSWREQDITSVVEEMEIRSDVKASGTQLTSQIVAQKPQIQRHSAQQPLSTQSRQQNHRQAESSQQQQPTQLKQPTESHHTIPHYMQATTSFQTHVRSTKEQRKTLDVLRARSNGGITKRVTTTKVPRYRSTTSINAIEDIKNEMMPEDVYIPMAARIKLFERGLGNGSNKTKPNVHKHSSQNANNSTLMKRPESSSPITTPSASTRNQKFSRDGSVPSYSRQTESSANREELIKKSHESSLQKRSSKDHGTNISTEPKEAKPFHFATRKRADLHNESFEDKLKLWKGKDKQEVDNQKNLQLKKGVKRKNDQPHPPKNKFQ